MRRLDSFAAVSLLILAGCTAEPEISEVTVTKTASETTTEAAETTSISTSAQAEPDCSNVALQRSPGFEKMEFFEGCEGNFARAGMPLSDHIELVQWDGSIWKAVPADGVWDGRGLQKQCYNPGRLEELGVPERIADKERRCGEYGPGETPPNKKSDSGYISAVALGESGAKYASEPACDGRGILIVDSVVDYGDRDDTLRRIAFEALAADPTGRSREYTYPGQCPSLRKQVDGNDIYPVYLDFGQDTDALCRAKATYGGNARVLSNREEFLDPC